jgi:hypothetical protein
MCILFYPKFLAREGTCKGDVRCGTHAFPRVTSVNPSACKYNRQDEPWEGIFSPFEPEPLSMEPVRPLPDYPGSSLKVVKPVFV